MYGCDCDILRLFVSYRKGDCMGGPPKLKSGNPTRKRENRPETARPPLRFSLAMGL
jgi:hypothetical protein